MTDYAILIKSDGSEIFIEANVRILEFNNHSYNIAIVHDITDRRRDDEQFHSLIEHLPGTVYRCLLDEQWTMLFINNQIEELTGYPASEFLGKNPLHTFAEFIHPDDLQSIWINTNKAVREKKFYINEYRMCHKDGTIRDVLAKGQAIYDEEGIPLHLDGNIIDVTKMKKAQRELAISKKETQNYLDIAQVLIMALDNDKNVIMINQEGADILGYSKDEIIGKNWIEKFVPLNFKEEVRKIADDIIDQVDEHNGHINPILTKSGKEREILWKSKTLYDDKGYAYGILTSGHDITELQKMQIKFKEQQNRSILQSRLAQMGEMISMIAHQWRQPLSAISMQASTISLDVELDNLDKKSLRKGADDIVKRTQKLSDTIEDFRDFYKPTKHPVRVKLENVIEKSLNIIYDALIHDNIKIIREYNSTEEIELYDGEVRQVILNILKNAQESFIKKQKQNQKITIKTKNRTIFIYNNGEEIPDDIIDKIFEPYFSTKDRKNGTGLGLYMAKTIIEEQHNGKLSVENRDDGVCFKIELGVIF